MFVFVYLMIYNNDVIIELYLLNYGVLMMPNEAQEGRAELKSNENSKKAELKTNQVADIKLAAELGSKKDRLRDEVLAYSY